MLSIHFILPEGPVRGASPVYRPVLPRGVLQVARAAELAGWEATVLDGYSAPHLLQAYYQALSGEVAVFPGAMELPDLVGLSVHGPPAIGPAMAIAARLREIMPSLPLLFGGQLANADAELLLPLLPERSILFCGDGDRNIGSVMEEALAATGKARLIRHTGVHPWRSLPDLDLLLPKYTDYFAEQDFEYHLETQIGCPYRCFHCGTGRKGLYARTMMRPIEAIQRELDQVVAWAKKADLHYPRLWITDETFGADKEHARAFCDALIARPEQWRWRAQSRADVVSEDLVKLMRKAGCERLAFGVEIPNDAGLDLLGKREGMKIVKEAFSICRSHGVSPEAIIVVGTPGDSTQPGEFLDALDLLEAESVQSYIYHPIPGSPWWKRYGGNLRGGSGSLRLWSDLDFHSPPLDASPAETERAVVAFLALQVWRPKSERIGPTMRSKDLVKCYKCSLDLKADRVFAHQPACIDIYRLCVDGKTFFLATNSKEAQVLQVDLTEHRNLYTSLFSVDGEVDFSLCPRCVIEKRLYNRSPMVNRHLGGEANLSSPLALE